MNFIKPFLVTATADIQALITRIGGHAMASFITVAEDGRPVSSFLPVDFIPSNEGGIGTILSHFANSNEQRLAVSPQGWGLVEFKSLDMYISPSWFVDRNRAPTNVHVAIQCYGRPEIIVDHEEKRKVLELQVQ